jgi:hypothetical protein
MQRGVMSPHMNPHVSNELARMRQDDLARSAERARHTQAAFPRQGRRVSTSLRETFAAPRVAVRVTVAFSRLLRFR